MPGSLVAPMLMLPRLDPKPWGGRHLEGLGLTLPPGQPIGEAVVTAGDALIANGPFAGRPLRSLVNDDPRRVTGDRGLSATGGRPLFPLLIKLIDAADDLSIQVHPDDAAAARHDSPGKTEVYHVLAAEPGAAIALGLRPGVAPIDFAAACRAGQRTSSFLRWIPAIPGQTILVPAGTVHALGAGCLVYEAQQSSDVTYRLDDWGRVDASGRPRELHVEPGLEVFIANSRPGPIAPLRLVSNAGRRHLLAACRWFAVERIALAAGEEVKARAAASPQVFTCLRGAIALATGAGMVAVRASETAIVTAAATTGSLRATAPAIILRAWVPDLPDDIVAPARAAGHDDAAIGGLGGPLPDLVPALAESTRPPLRIGRLW